MKKLSASHQKILKSIHLIVAGVWLAGVIVLTAMPLVLKQTHNGDELFMYNYIYHFVDMDILTPAAILTLVTGLIFSIFTKWGFLKHGWIVGKWIITLGIIITGTFYLGPMVEKLLGISDVERIASLSNEYYRHGTKVGLWAGFINTTLLVVAVFFSVLKPWKNLGKK